MKVVPYVLILLYYTWNVHIPPVETLMKERIPKVIEPCTIDQRFDDHIRISAFIEEISTNPMTIHMIEPNVSMEAHIPIWKKKSLQGSWITWFVFKDSSSCFLRDDVKTDVMKRKSKSLQEQLQSKMSERN